MFGWPLFAAWKGINESDMVLMPDASTRRIDPFFADFYPDYPLRHPRARTSGYDRDPRSIAKRAEDYLRATGIADTVLFGPEPEFFLFDDIRFGASISGSHVAIGRYSARTSTKYEGGNKGHRPGVKGGYFPVPPVDFRCRISVLNVRWSWSRWAPAVEAHHHE